MVAKKTETEGTKTATEQQEQQQEAAPKGLYAKLVAVQRKLKAPAKTGKHYHGFRYQTSGDILDPIRQVCNEEGLFFSCSIVSTELKEARVIRNEAAATTGYAAFVVAKALVVDPETGESHEVTAPGYSDPTAGKGGSLDDKAIYKATTGAQKYAARLLFALPSDESDLETEQQPKATSKTTKTTARPQTVEEEFFNRPLQDPNLISEPQRKRLIAIANEVGLSKVEASAVVKAHGYASSKDILKKDYDKIVKAIQDKAKKEVLGMAGATN